MNLLLNLGIILQAQIDDPIETVNRIQNNLNKESIEMSKAINDLGALTVMSGVLITLMLFTFGYLIFQLISHSKKLSVIEDYSKKGLRYLDNEYQRELTKEQAETILRLYTKNYRLETVAQVIKIIKENNLSDRTKVLAKITTFVKLSYNRMINELKRFTYREMTLDKCIDDEFDNLLISQMDADTQEKEFEIYSLAERYTNLFTQIEIKQNNKLNNII